MASCRNCTDGRTTKFNEFGQENGTEPCSCGGRGDPEEEKKPENNDGANFFRALFGFRSVEESRRARGSGSGTTTETSHAPHNKD